MANELRDLAAACTQLVAGLEAVQMGMPLIGTGDAEEIRRLLGNPPDLVERPVGRSAHVLYLGSVVDHSRIEEGVMQPLSVHQNETSAVDPPLWASTSTPVHLYGEAVDAILAAKVLILMRGYPGGHVVSMDAWPQRQVAEPPAEVVARGPHLGFVEDLTTNLALVRQGIPDRRLRVEEIHTGSRSGTKGVLLYLEGVASRSVLTEVRRQLAAAKPSFVTDTSMLAQWLSPASGILLPTIGTTERPDHATAEVLNGKIMLLASGSPTALLMPNTFGDLLHVPEDYYERSLTATFTRSIRLFGLAVAIVTTPLFVAVDSINHELLPGKLFLTFSTNRQGVPMPLAVEVLIMEVIVEVIREAGLRLPGPVGQSIAIIGAVVIGQAALLAGLISAPAVVVVSLAFIASFVLPSSDLVAALRLLRFALILLGAFFGLLGITWGILVILVYVASLTSFGVPYLAPVSPRRNRGLQDFLVRLPLPNLKRSFMAHSVSPPAPATKEERGNASGPAQLSSQQFFWMLVLVSLPTDILFLPGTLLQNGGREAWLTSAIAAAPWILAAWGLGFAAGRLGDLVTTARTYLGPIAGRIVLFAEWVAVGSYVIITIGGMIQMAEATFVTASVPMWVLTLLGLIPAGILAWLGPVVTGRTALVLGPSLIAVLVGVELLTVSTIHWLWVLPFWPRSLRFANTASILYSWVWLAEPVFIGAGLMHHVKPTARKACGRTMALVVTTLAALGTIGVWDIIATFGAQRAATFLLPFIPFVNGVRLGPHLGHLATVVIPVETAGAAVSTGILLWVWKRLSGRAAWGMWSVAVVVGETIGAGGVALLLFGNVQTLNTITLHWVAAVALPVLAAGSLATYGLAALRARESR